MNTWKTYSYIKQTILYQFQRDMYLWENLKRPKYMQRTWWQPLATPHTGLRVFSTMHSQQTSASCPWGCQMGFLLGVPRFDFFCCPTAWKNVPFQQLRNMHHKKYLSENYWRCLHKKRGQTKTALTWYTEGEAPIKLRHEFFHECTFSAARRATDDDRLDGGSHFG